MSITYDKQKIEKAMKKAKEHFGSQCIVTGLGNPDGCHILPRSTHPHLKACVYNVVPLARNLHMKMDEHRPAERIEWLRAVVPSENRELLDQWLLNLLVRIVEAT